MPTALRVHTAFTYTYVRIYVQMTVANCSRSRHSGSRSVHDISSRRGLNEPVALRRDQIAKFFFATYRTIHSVKV